MSRRRYPTVRARYGIALGAAFAAVALLGPATVVRAGSHRPVYFFSNNSQPINDHNRLVMRPRGFVLFLDGQWVLQNLHWTGWGSAVARATGVSNSSTDNPDPARGRRIKTWADMTLSNPVRWHGHMVYSCFKVLVPPPAGDLSGCVLPNPPIGSGWLLAGGNDGVEFLAPGKRIWCGISKYAIVLCRLPEWAVARGRPDPRRDAHSRRDRLALLGPGRARRMCAGLGRNAARASDRGTRSRGQRAVPIPEPWDRLHDRVW